MTTENAVLYVRQSEDRAGEGAAVERQIQDARRLAQVRGWTITAEHRDNDVSAAGSARRPGFEAVLGAVAGGQVRAVIAWDMTRLTRNRRDLVRLVEAGEQARVVLAFVRGSDMDLSTPAGRLSADILAGVARHEIDQKSDRQKRANTQRAEAGHARWSRRPYGYQRGPDGRAVVVEHEADAIRRAAELALSGATLASIARDLNAGGHRTSLGGAWHVTGVRRVLLNPRYSGRCFHNGAEVAAGDWPAILDPDEQQRLSEVLRDPTRRLQQGVELRYLLSGAARCGVCGARMFAAPAAAKGRRYMTYRCVQGKGHLTRRLDLVDKVVEDVVLGRLARPDAAALLAPDVDVDEMRGAVDARRERRAGIAAMLADGLLGATEAREQAGRLTTQIRELEARIGAAVSTSPAAALALAEDVPAVWSSLPVRTRREVVELLAEVTILPAGRGARFDPASVRIEWRA